MPQIGWFELLIIVIIAILVIGPKDFPIVLNKIGHWVGSIKRFFSEVQNNVTRITDIEDEKIENKVNKEKSDEKFSKNGEFYITGDTGKTDKDGYFYFISRDDDVIIMAGYRIGPFEVEAALSTNPAVNECAVIAAPDNIRGEVIEAFVVLKPNYLPSEELTKLLQEWVKTKFAAHAYPRSIHYVNSLPKNPSGKIQRYVLRDSRKHNHGSK